MDAPEVSPDVDLPSEYRFLSIVFSIYPLMSDAPEHTFTDDKLVFRTGWVRQLIVRFYHRLSKSLGNCLIVGLLRGISGWWWKDAIESALSHTRLVVGRDEDLQHVH